MLNKKLISDGLWTTFSRAGIGLSLLLSARLLTEYLSPQNYGILGLLLSLSGLAFNLCYQPLFIATLRFYPKSLRGGYSNALKRILLLKLKKYSIFVLTIIFLVGGGVNLATDMHFSLVLLILTGLLILFIGWRSFYTFLYEAEKKHKNSSMWKLVESWLKLAFSILIVSKILGGVSGVLLGFLIGVTLSGFLFFPSSKQEHVETQVLPTSFDRDFQEFMLPLIFIGLLNWIIGFSDRFIISTLSSPNEAGIYYATYGLISFPMIQIGGILVTIMLPVIFSNRESKDVNINIWLIVVSFVALFLTMFVYFFSDLIAYLFLAKDFRSGAPYMVWIASGYGFLSIAMVCDGKIMLENKTIHMLNILIIVATTNITLNLLLIPIYGGYGAALSTSFSFLIQLIVSLYYMRNPKGIMLFNLTNIIKEK